VRQAATQRNRKLASGGRCSLNGGMALQGDVRTIPVRELLGWLAGRRATGTLSLSRGMVAWRFQLRGGRVEMASSADRETMLGRLLVERGLIDQAQLEEALKEGRRTRARLGKTLARAGLVSAASLADLLSAKVEGLLQEALSWTEGRFFFDDDTRPRRVPAVRTPIDLAPLIARAASEPQPVNDADVLEVSEIAPPGWPWHEQLP
jgi:Domain of unknown function (DUF4388)